MMKEEDLYKVNLVKNTDSLLEVPYYVHKFIKKRKEFGYSLHDSLDWLRHVSTKNSDADITSWKLALEEDGSRMDEVFAEAWVLGYRFLHEKLFYARVKGSDKLPEALNHLVYLKTDINGNLTEKVVSSREETNPETMKLWKELGINDSNADFEQVED